MPDHPPPAPDWILGPDGHWRPPPFEPGRPSGFAPPPGPGGAAGPPPIGGPQWPPAGPPPAPSSTGRAAIVLGALGVGLVGLLVVSIAAVTFLGTTKSGSESVRLSPADGSTSGGNDDSADAQDPGEATGAPLSEQVAVQIGADLAGEGWVQQEAEPVPMEEAGASCMPPGWREGVTDRYRIAFHAEGIGDTEVRTSAYATAEQAQADLVRASTDEFRACLEQTAEEYSGVDVTVQALPADPSTPGVTYRSTAITSDGPLVQDDTYVIVGRVRAYITYCTCEALDETHRRGIALEAAASLASAQGLPSPA